MSIRQIVLLFVVGVAAIWGGYTGYNRFLVPEAKAASTQNQTATVTRGSLQATVSASGNAVAIRQTKLSFGAAGTLGDIPVRVGDKVKAGDTLASLDGTTVATLKTAVTQAEANLNIARITLAQTQNPYTDFDVSMARQTVAQAETTLRAAKKDLESAQPLSELNMSLAEATVKQATTALEIAKRNLAVVQNDPTSNDSIRTLEDQQSYYTRAYISTKNRFDDGAVSQERVNQDYSNMLLAQDKLAQAREKQASSQASAQNDVAKAQDALARAQNDLASKQAGPDSDVERKRAAVTAAEIALAKSKDDLAKKLAGGDPKDIEKQNNQVVSAQASLDSSRQKLQGVVITAPFDGIVAAVSANFGDPVGANAVVVTLLDPNALRVDVSIAESDVASVQAGQSASITFDALPSRTFQGKVISVAPSAKVQQGVVNYPVSISLDQAPGVKDLMTASAQVVTQKKDNILLVPNRAIRSQGRTRTAQLLLPNGTTETRTIQTGMSGDQTTEVTSGLQEGDKVVIPTTTTTNRGVPGAGGFSAPAGGGFMGGAPAGGGFIMPPTSKP